MMNSSQVLSRLNISSDSRLMAVQQVRTYIENSENPINAAKVIISNLTTDFELDSNDPIEARMTAQYLVDSAITLGDKYDPEQALLKAATRIAKARIDSPWYFYTDSYSTVESKTEVIEGVQVEVKVNGQLKKGSKQILAKALYEKHKLLDNKAIIEIFMKELDMSKPGATTYLHNAKKAAK